MTRSATTVSKNQQFTVTVSQDAADLFAYDLTVGFDSSSFNLTSATVDARGITDAESGKDSVTAIDTKIGRHPDRRPTTLVTLTFKAKQPAHRRHRCDEPPDGGLERNGRIDFLNSAKGEWPA